MASDDNLRILVVDDNPSIHEDFKKILAGKADEKAAALDALSDDFFGDAPAPTTAPAPATATSATKSAPSGSAPKYEITTASQGQEALERVKEVAARRKPFAMAFVDVRMPPGWDGIRTIAELWKVDPDLQVVVCTAFSDYSYDEILAQLGRSDRLLILKKPFDAVEVQQMALALTAKRNTHDRERLYVEEIKAYTASLETVNRALASDKATAEAYSQAKQQFIEAAARAFGQPAHSIVASLESAITHVQQDHTLARMIEEILPRAEDVAELADQIVELTVLEKKEVRLDRTPLDFFALLGRLEDVGRRHAESRTCAFALKQRSVLPTHVKADLTRFEALLDNLVRGCIDLAVGCSSAPNKEVRTVVALEREGSLHHDSLVVDLVLPGVALTPAQRQSLFEPFDPAGGVGESRLHLPLARQLARLHGSDVEVRTGDANSTTIHVSLDPGSLEGVECKLRAA
jgi:CheY-like chemotaxis protein